MPNEVRSKIIWNDDFSEGFDLGAAGSASKWSTLGMGAFQPVDGVVSKTPSGVSIAPPGRNPRSGEPAFSMTIPQNAAGNGLPGVLDHVKWSALANPQSPTGALGFSTPPGATLSIEAVLGGRTYGTREHPFGDAVSDPEADPRLAISSLMAADPESGLVFDIGLTNNTIYAIYERVEFPRPVLGNIAAFLFCVPVGRRKPGDMHTLKISYNRDVNMVKWFLDDVEVLKVENLGKRIDRKFMILDKGGEEIVSSINQLTGGLGLFTILDGAIAGGPTLVDLTGAPGDFDPAKGEPALRTFVDKDSKESSRLFGQGAQLICNRFVVSYE